MNFQNLTFFSFAKLEHHLDDFTLGLVFHKRPLAVKTLIQLIHTVSAECYCQLVCNSERFAGYFFFKVEKKSSTCPKSVYKSTTYYKIYYKILHNKIYSRRSDIIFSAFMWCNILYLPHMDARNMSFGAWIWFQKSEHALARSKLVPKCLCSLEARPIFL